MSKKKWVVDLSADERRELLELIYKDKATPRRLTRAHLLLLADELVERRVVGANLDETVRRMLKKKKLAPWLRQR